MNAVSIAANNVAINARTLRGLIPFWLFIEFLLLN
jgi:hypothetical protein